MSSKIEEISYISEKEKSEKVQGQWQQVIDARDNAELEIAKIHFSTTDNLVQEIREAIFSNNDQKIDVAPNLKPSEVKDITKEIRAEEEEIIAKAEAEVEEISKNQNTKGTLNPHWHNIQLAMKIDALYSDKILGKGNKIKEKLNLQKQLLDLKAMLPKDFSSDKAELSDDLKSKIEELNSKYDLGLDSENFSSLVMQIDSNLDTIKLDVQHGFTELQTLNHERMLVFHLAQKQKDEKDTFVRNQIAR